MGGPGTGVRLAALLLAWLAGVAAQLQERALLAQAIYVALAIGAVIAIALVLRLRRGFGVAVVAVAIAGFASAGWRASARLADTLDPALEVRDLVVAGVVASLPQQGSNGLRFRFRVESASGGVALPETLALGWYAGFHEDAAAVSPRGELRAGQRWRFTVRLRQPHGNLNPNGFDYELLLFEQGVRATGYVRDAPPPQLLDAVAGEPVERLRQRVRDAIYASVADRRAAGVLAALAVGDQSAIERDDWELFRNTGVAHLMSISGLHVTMFAWLAGIGIGWLWRRSDRAMLLVPAPLAARLGGVAAAAAYAVFSGWGVPSQRTVWMLATVALLQSSGRRWPWLLVLLTAAVVVTALDPWALTQAGFWLSFMAVGLLMVSSPLDRESAASSAAVGWRRWPSQAAGSARQGLRSQVIATLGLTPLTLVFFQQVSIVGFVANLVAIPIVTLVVTPLALLGVALAPLWALGAWLVQRLVGVLGALAGVPGAVWVVPAAPLWAQLAGLAAAALVVMPLPWRLRLLALPLALGLLWPPRTLPEDGSFDLVAADVGQGTAVLVRTRRHALLFDAGPQYSRDSDAGQRVLVPWLRSRGDEHLDLLMLSHRDLDHVGGARAVLGSLRVDAMSSSLEAGHPLHALAPRSTRCEAGQRWQWDGVDFAVLRPTAADYDAALKANAMSCVLRVSGGGRSALLTGDIEREQEAALLLADSGAGALKSDVLVAPHHGSRTSSTAAFLDAVQPKAAIFQAGYRNRFGHPAADVLERYRERGIAIVASPSCGAWTWRAADAASGAAGGRCQRDVQRRYWHHAEAPGAP